MTNTNSSNKYKLSEKITPGLLLRAKREQLEMNVEDIAKNIHLEKKIIEAIEADDYENLPAAIYIRGYLRSYAKIVGADAEHIIGLYNSDTPFEEPEILPEVKPPTQASSSDKPVKAFTYLISLGLVLLLLIWYQSNFVVEPNQEKQSTVSNPDFINGVDTTFEVIIHPEGWKSPDKTELYVSDEINENTDMLELQIDSNNDNTELLPIENVISDEVVGTGSDFITLKLIQDSWIEVYDVNDERLFLDLGIANEVYIINGSAPFDVILGNSKGVVVEFNGNPFDHTPYDNKGVARFTLSTQ